MKISSEYDRWFMIPLFRKKFQLRSASLPPTPSPARPYGRGVERTVKFLLLVVIGPFYLCGFNFSRSRWNCGPNSQIRIWSARNNMTSDNWVFPIIRCPPVCNGCGMPTEDAYSSGHLVLSHFWTCMCSNVETNLSWICLVSGFLNFEHPSVFLFCFETQ